MITVKFGGSSLADATQIQKAAQIVKSNPDRRYVVVSAPGKRFSKDEKITDLLYDCYEAASQKESYEQSFQKIKDRFTSIIAELGISFDLETEMNQIRTNLDTNPQKEYIASRGEYLNAKIMSEVLGFPFIDAKDHILFDENHKFIEQETYDTFGKILTSMPNAVIPGFYGTTPDGNIATFTRGGSDVTGAIVARCVNTDLYENWTDVNGFQVADPRILKDSKRIEWISYRELRELSYMGASVLHEDAVFPIRSVGIPLNIRNTNEPDNPGTMISNTSRSVRSNILAGIAGKKGISNLQIEKAMMNQEVGFGAKVLNIIAKYNVPYEHTPTSIDTMSVLAETKDLKPRQNEIIQEINETLHPDQVKIQDNIALVSVVGERLSHQTGAAARLFQVLANADINVCMIDVGFSEMNMIVGIHEQDYEKAIQVIYDGMRDMF